MKIYSGKHFNKDVYILENDQLQVKVLKDFGAKVVSIYKKDLDFELLFQPSDKAYKDPSDKAYKDPSLGDDFEAYDRSGIDEMLPTIDSCYYPNSYRKLNDHGDLWTQKWDFEIRENSLLAKVRCDSIKLDLEREISLDGDQVKFSYKLKNPTVQDHLYLWAFHGLMTYSDQVEIDFGHAGEVLNVIDGKTYDFDYRKLSLYPDKNVYKFYFEDEIAEGNVNIHYKKEKLKVQMNFTTDINKYLGFWLTKGGLKGEYNFALEPASGYYDSLDRAFKNNKFSKIASKEEKTWDLTLTFRKEND